MTPRLIRALSLLFLLGALACSGPSDARPQGTDGFVTVRGTRVAVEVVTRPAEQALGLGQRDSLAWGRGMLFTYDEPRGAGFWMKDMRFAIDIIWIRDGRIRDIHHRVPPPEPGVADHQLAIYRPRELVDRVLEVPAGYAASSDWGPGDSVRFEP